MNTHDDDEAWDRPSRSQRKRDHQALIELGRELTALPETQRRKLDMDADLAEALNQAARLKPGNARERQFRYLGRLLSDRDTAALQHTLSDLQQPQREDTQLLHRCEHWRQRLLDEGDTALADFLQQYPAADRQRLHSLLAEAAPATALKARRSLFRYLRDFL